MKRVPLAKVVIRGGCPGGRKGARALYVATAYDVEGHMRSRVSDLDRAYVERKIAEWWPGIPVEDETNDGGAVRRDKSFREKARGWFKKTGSDLRRDAELIAKAAVELGAKDAQTLFAHIIREKRLTLVEQMVLKERALKLISELKPAEKKAARKKLGKTFLQARTEILDTLGEDGWDLSSRSLKIPHATSPSGRLRLWFKPQAVWFSRGTHHVLGNAHTVSYDLDIRVMSGRSFVEYIFRHFPEAR